MELSRKNVRIIIALSVVALLGLVLLQSYLIGIAMEMKEQAFQRNVANAMSAVSRKLETREAAQNIMHPDAAPRQERMIVRSFSSSLPSDGKSVAGGIARMQTLPAPNPPVMVTGDTLCYTVTSPQRVSLQVFDPAIGRDSLIVDTVRKPGTYAIVLNKVREKGGTYYVRYRTDSASAVFQVTAEAGGEFVPQTVSTGARQELVSRVVDNLLYAEGKPIERRVDAATLDSVIGASLQESGIGSPYAFGILVGPRDTLAIARPANYADELRRSGFRSPLFPNDILPPRNDLCLYFPDHSLYLWKQVGPVLGATFVFMVIVVLLFGYTIRTILTQKRLATTLVDFINNMTHEFKTPLSTVALASEGIMRPDIIGKKEKVLRFNRVIQEEAQRMKTQVDKILQMAVLERGEFDLHLEVVDVHRLLAAIVEKAALRMEPRHGIIRTALNAEAHGIRADLVHLTNIVNTLLDNAEKYSAGPPDITITTFNRNDTIVVRIEDKGIGIPSEHLKRVFEKYYRVPSGNLHDVKGFGLGLSYARLMATAHGGSIRLESSPGHGTSVDLTLPLVDQHR